MIRPLVALLLLAVVIVLGVAIVLRVARPRESLSAPAEIAPVPDAALQALRQGRYLRASLVLREYLGATRDTSAAALLLSAQAEAGWGDWERVQQLLSGRAWLDTLGAGHGWELLGRSQLELGRWRASQGSYARFLALSDTGADRAQGLARVRQAQAQEAEGEFAHAVASYRSARQDLPQIADWLHLFAASAAASAGDTLVVEQELAGADSAVRIDWGWRARARAREAAGNVRSALAVAAAVASTHHAGTTRAEADTRAGELRLTLGDSTGARAAFLRALDRAPATAHALTAARALARLPNTPMSRLRPIADVQLRHGDLDGARDSYARFLGSGLATPEQRIEILDAIGRALFATGRYLEAESRLRAVAADSRDPDQAAAALYTAARAQYRDGRKSEANGTLQRVLDLFPRTSAAADAAFLLADLDHDRGALDLAHANYRMATVLAPGSTAAGLARMRLAGLAFARGDHEAALQHYQAYLTAFPDGRRAQQARYWAALALLELGHNVEAKRLLQRVRDTEPFSYYGVRAADRLNEGFWHVHLEPSPGRNAEQDALVARALARLELLGELGWRQAAEFELGRARRHFALWDGALYSLAEGLIQRGFTTDGMAMARELYQREGAWNLRLLRILYPFPYHEMIFGEAAERGIDPFLAAGLIRQESMFDARAVSRAGAVGLMQVMPATGRALARRLGVRKFTPAALTRPDVNLHLGMTFLADQLQAWNGRLVPVLAAYNAGPARVQRWRSLPEWGRDELFTERIPFTETRDYVKSVLRNAALYRALYSSVFTVPAAE